MHKGGTKFHKAGYGLGLVNGFLLKSLQHLKKEEDLKIHYASYYFLQPQRLKTR
jgi:hypothetical protein